MDPLFLKRIYASHQACPKCPSAESVSNFYVKLLGALFSDFAQLSHLSEHGLQRLFDHLDSELYTLLENTGNTQPAAVTKEFFDSLPALYDQLLEDVDSMYEGDPAAESTSEVIRTYPGFYAIAAYRIAHRLLQLGVEGIPRIITEHAHSKTGIDIHPAARIGHHFCIDHGTGIVIGETTHIGDHVKLYQGVTLGALSVNKDDAEKKRHPTIEDRVVIYAGATILGGETTVGHDSVIGGNVWLTRSVPANSKVYYQSRMFNSDTNETDLVIFKAD